MTGLKTLISTLGIDSTRAIILPSGGDYLHHSFDVNPEDFLEQAELDYESGGNAALLNSITNAKRAIRSQIDEALYYLGFDAKKMKIQRKIELLREIGIIAPRILRKVDDSRNLLEHEYITPKIQEVEEALDLANLFVEAMSRGILGSEFVMGNEDEFIEDTVEDFLNRIIFQFDVKNKFFKVSGNRAIPSSQSSPVTEYTWLKDNVVIANPDPMYIHVLRMAIAVEKDYETRKKKAVLDFFAAIL